MHSHQHPADPTRAAPPGIPNFDPLCYVARGKFGEVWLARERLTDVRRAVKILRKTDEAKARHELEGVKQYQHCAHNHPHLLQILAIGETDECFYYVMEAADNDAPPTATDYRASTLRGVLNRREHRDGRAALQLISKLLDAVRQLHVQDLAHHDLKPENVLIVSGQPKVGDVGLVRRKGAGTNSGTPAYMTPEGRPDDTYATGKILYEIVNGLPADAFPRPASDLMPYSSPELTAAIRIFNRACAHDPSKRFPSIEDMIDQVQRALTPARGLAPWWRRQSPTRRAFLLGVPAVGLGASFWWAQFRFGPIRLDEIAIDSTLSDWTLVKRANQSAERLYTYLKVDGEAFKEPGTYLYDLRDISVDRDDLILDFLINSPRPWGNASIGLAQERDGTPIARVQFKGQPGGLGLCIFLYGTNSAGQVQESTAIEGHPQTGVDYRVRLALFGDEVAIAVWPLSRPTPVPIVRTLPRPPGGLTPRYLIVTENTGDRLASADVKKICVAIPSRTPGRIEELPVPDVAASLETATIPARVPVLAEDAGPIFDHILAGDWHPYDSDAWTTIGNWSWWSGASAEGAPKSVCCSPYSKALRQLDTRKDGDYYGHQHLRFDRARYSRFEARLPITLEAPQSDQRRPFVCHSESGSIGFAFHLQDQAPPGCVWGGGYYFSICIDPVETVPTIATVVRMRGLRLGVVDEFSVVPASGTQTLGNSISRPRLPRDVLLSKDGFELTLRVDGPRIEVFLNDDLIIDARDDTPQAFSFGRIALYASRIIANFEALELLPLEN